VDELQYFSITEYFRDQQERIAAKLLTHKCQLTHNINTGCIEVRSRQDGYVMALAEMGLSHVVDLDIQLIGPNFKRLLKNMSSPTRAK
jgi:hypothetical protein